MVDRISTPSTNNVSPVAVNNNQARPQINTPTPSDNSNAANLRAVVSALGQLSPGQSITAQVSSSQALTSSEQSLLQRVNPDLAQQLRGGLFNQQTQTSGIATGATPNNSGQITLQGPLYLTNLTINASNTSANIEALINAKTLTTITTQAFSTNQILTLGQQNGQLVIASSNQLQLNLQEKLQQAASQTIKNILPRQENVSQLQQFVSQLGQIINQLPTALQTKLVSPQTLQTINQLNNFTQTSDSLAQATQVRQALSNSGVAFETKLALANTSGTQPSNSLGLQQDIRAVLDKLLISITSPAGSGISPNPLNQADLKDIISTVINTQNSITPPLAAQVDSTKPLSAATLALFRLLGVQIPADTQALGQLPKVIEQHLKKLIEQTQAKIQLNQLRSLGLDQPTSDSRTNLQQFQTELPLRFGDQVLPLQINIQEQAIVKERYQDEDSTDKKEDSDKKVRRWQVFLSFDLLNEEKLHSQLTIVESSVSATLWAESTLLCYKAQKDIAWLRDKLLSHGLTVEDITCLQGKPQQRETSLDYNLVDIKT